MNNLRMITTTFCTLVAIFFCFLSLTAQTPKTTEPIIAGVVNGKAVSLPKPIYPEEARKSGAAGSIKVQVIIDENGNVISAKAVDEADNILLRKVSEEAAMKAKFSPTTLSGKPAKVTGVIIYNFTSEKSNEEKLKMTALSLFLVIVRQFSSDLKALNKSAGEDRSLQEVISEFPDFATELTPLVSLETTAIPKRIEIIDQASVSIRTKLTASDGWQFEMGKHLGDFMLPFFIAGNDENIDLSKIDQSAMKVSLTKIKQLLPSAPADFPKDVLKNLANLAEFGEKENLLTPEIFPELQNKMTALLESISPNSTK